MEYIDSGSSSSSAPQSDPSSSASKRGPSYWSSKPKNKPTREKTEEEKKFKRRAKYFLATQVVAVLIFLSILGGSNDAEVELGDDDSLVERDTGRPRGFGFLTFADRKGMYYAIRDMHGKEFSERVISVNKAQPKGAEDSGHGYGSHSVGRGSYGGRERPPAGQDDCFKCGRPGHWARDCPSAGGGRGARPLSPPPRSKYGGAPSRGDRYAAGDRDILVFYVPC